MPMAVKPVAEVEQPVLPEVVEEDVVTVTDETSGALTPEGNLTLVDDYHTDYSDGSGQQFITLVSASRQHLLLWSLTAMPRGSRPSTL
ncbi:MAG: CD1107 family mobile element protein [Faecalibacterium prausnitzii]